MGRLETEAFRNSGLVITAQRHRSVIATPRDAKAARTAPSLERRVRLFHNALVLLGCAYNRRALIVQGNTYGSSEHLGPISTGLPVSHSLGYRRLRRITAADLERAATMLLSLEHVYRHAPRPLYRRIRKGFNCWIHAVWNTDLGEKLHFFVRSIEAITRAASGQRTPQGSTPRSITAMFRERAQTFAGQSKQSIRTIDQFYVLRSAVEHVYDVMPRLRKPSGISRDEAFAFRTLQAEIAASTVYSRIFSSKALREQLRTERRVEAFWALSYEERELLFGEAVNLNTMARWEFRPAQARARDLL